MVDVKVTTTDGQVFIDPNEAGWWKKLRQLCIDKGLKIKKLEAGGEEIAPHADAYFCVFQMTATMPVGANTTMKGVGFYLTDKQKGRIWWYVNGKRAYGENFKAKNGYSYISELLIPHEMPQT